MTRSRRTYYAVEHLGMAEARYLVATDHPDDPAISVRVLADGSRQYVYVDPDEPDDVSPRHRRAAASAVAALERSRR